MRIFGRNYSRYSLPLAAVLLVLFSLPRFGATQEPAKPVHAPGEEPGRKVDPAQERAPRAPYCSPDFQFDLRYFHDPQLEPLLAAIEKAQHRQAVTFYQQLNGTDTQRRLGRVGLEHLLIRAAPKPDDKVFGSWALYLTLSGDAGLTVFDENDRGLLKKHLHEETATRSAAPTAPDWLKALPLNPPARADRPDPAPGIDWHALFNDETKTEAVYGKLFAGHTALPPANGSLSAWREKAAALLAPGNQDLGKLSYLELTVLKEHLLNRFDAFSAEQIEHERAVADDDKSTDPNRNYLAYISKFKRLSGKARLDRRENERLEACLRGNACDPKTPGCLPVLRELSDFTSRYSAQLDDNAKLTGDPSKWRRHGLGLEQRAALAKHFDESSRSRPLDENNRPVADLTNPVAAHLTLKAAQAMMQPVAGGRARQLFGPTDANERTFVDGLGSLTPAEVLGILYNAPTFGPANRWMSFQELKRVVPQNDPAAIKKQNENLDNIDHAQALNDSIDRAKREIEVNTLAEIFKLAGRELTPAELEYLKHLPEVDFGPLSGLLHSLSGVPKDATGVAFLKQFVNQKFGRLFGMRLPPGRADLIKGLDLSNPGGGVRFEPARLEKLVLFPGSEDPMQDELGERLNQRILDHFAGQVRDAATARAAFPSRAKLFSVYEGLYAQRHGRSLRAEICPEPCDINQPPSDKELLHLARFMRVETLAAAPQNRELVDRFDDIARKSVAGLTGRKLELTQRALRLRFEHDLIQSELKRMHTAIAECKANGGGNRCVGDEAVEAKRVLWQQLYKDLERQRADLGHEIDGMAGKPSEAEYLAVVRGLSQQVDEIQAMLAKEAHGHLVATPRVESGVAFDRKAYLEGNPPLNASEKRTSSEEAGTHYALPGFVDLEIPCDSDSKNILKLKNVPEEVLRSSELFYAYLKRRAMIETLQDGGLNDTEIDEVLAGKSEIVSDGTDKPLRRKLYWDYERLKARFISAGKFKIGNGYFGLDTMYYRLQFEDGPALGDSNEPYIPTYSPNSKSCGSFDTFKHYLGWLQIVRGDSQHAASYRNYFDPADQALRRIFHLDGGRRVRIAYQTAPPELKAQVASLEAMDDAAATAEVRKLATGDAAERKRFRDLMSYFDRYPEDHPLRAIVMGPNIPEHLRDILKKRADLRNLWESASPAFQQREHTLFSLGLHQVNEKPEDLEKRLKVAARDNRRQLAGGNGGLEDDNQTPGKNEAGATKTYSAFKHDGLIRGTVEHWMKGAIEGDDSTFAARLASPQIYFDAVESDKQDDPWMSPISALHEAKSFFLMNLLEARRVLKSQPSFTGFSPDILALVKGPDGKPDLRKVERMEKLLRAAVLQINANIQNRGGALQDPAVMQMPPMKVLEAELEGLERAFHGPPTAGGKFKPAGSIDPPFKNGDVVWPRETGESQTRDEFERNFAYLRDRLFEHRMLLPLDNDEARRWADSVDDPKQMFDKSRWRPPSKILTSEDGFLGLRQCDYFLFLQNGKHQGFKYNGIPPASRVLIQNLSPTVREVLEELCTYYFRQTNYGHDENGASRYPEVDKAITETILGAWPSRVLATMMKNDVLRQSYSTRLRARFEDRLLFFRLAFEEREKERGQGLSRYTPRDITKDPEYRLLQILGGKRVEGPPWSTIASSWGVKGLPGLILELPKMKRPEKEVFLQWAYHELLAQYPNVEQLRKLPPAEIDKLIQAELRHYGGTSPFGKLDLRPGKYNTGDAAKPLLVLLISLINESGNDARGTEGMMLDQSLGGRDRFSPLFVAIQVANNRAQSGTVATVPNGAPVPNGIPASNGVPVPNAAPAPFGAPPPGAFDAKPHLQLGTALDELKAQRTTMSFREVDILHIENKQGRQRPSIEVIKELQAERKQLNIDLPAMKAVYDPEGVDLGKLVGKEPKDLTADERKIFRERIMTQLRDNGLRVPGVHDGGPSKLSPVTKSRLEAIYTQALAVLDQADAHHAAAVAAAPAVVTNPDPNAPKGRWVKPGKVQFSAEAADWLHKLGITENKAAPTRVCEIGGVKELESALRAHQLYEQVQALNTAGQTVEAGKKLKATQELRAVNPGLPDEVEKVTALVDEIARLGQAHRTFFLPLVAKHLQPLGCLWGREDLTAPVLKHPEQLADAGVRAKLLKEIQAAQADFDKTAPARAAMRAVDPQWEEKIKGLYRSLIGILETADAPARTQKIAQYVKDLQAAQDAYSSFEPGIMQRRLQLLSSECGARLERVRAQLDGKPKRDLVSDNLNKYLSAVGMSQGQNNRGPDLANLILSFHPASGRHAEVVRAVQQLKDLRAAWQKDTAAQAELKGFSAPLTATFPPALDQAIAYGEKVLARHPAPSPAMDLLGRSNLILADNPNRLSSSSVHYFDGLRYLTYPRALELKASYQAQRKQLDDAAMKRELDAIDPALHAKLVAYHDHVLATLDAFAKSPSPSEDKALLAMVERNSQLAGEISGDSFTRFSTEKLAPSEGRAELSKLLQDGLKLVRDAEHQHAADDKGVFVPEAPGPRPLAEVPKAGQPGFMGPVQPPPPTLPPDERPAQLAKLLELLDKEGIGLNDGQRQAILTRDPEVNQILLDLYDPMHSTLVNQGIAGLPALWRQLAQTGSGDDIREARMVLLPHSEAFESRNAVSPAKLRQKIRDDLRRTGKLSPEGLAAAQTLAQAEVVQKWLPDRLKDVFAALTPEDAKTLVRAIAAQQQSVTDRYARDLVEELRHEVAVDEASKYLRTLREANVASGVPVPDSVLQERVRNLLRLAQRDPREKGLTPADAAILKDPPEFLKTVRTIYNLDPVPQYLASLRAVTDESQNAELSAPPERRNDAALRAYAVVRSQFLPELGKKTEELVKGGMAPSDAIDQAYRELMQKAEFQGHAQTLEALRADMHRESRSRWLGASAPGTLLLRGLAVDAKQERPNWCAEKTEKAWGDWDTAEKKRAEKLEKSETAKQWEAFRIESRKRRDAILAQQAESTDEINRSLQEIQITSRKAADLRCAQDPFATGCPRAGQQKKPDEKTDWDRMPEETRRQYRATLKAVERDLEVRRGKLENAYRKLREVTATMNALAGELQEKQQKLMQQLSGQIVRPEGYETSKQKFLRSFVDAHDGTLSDAVGRGRAAWLERYFDWRDRADDLGRTLAEGVGPGVIPPNWENDARVKALLDEVKDTADGCPVPKDKALAIVRAGIDSQQAELNTRKQLLETLGRYGITFNGLALDFDDFKIDPNDGKTPEQRFAEIRDALTRLGPVLPQGTKDRSLVAINSLLQGSPWQQFEERLLTKWNIEARRPMMEWFNPAKATNPVSGAAVEVVRKPDGTFEFKFRPLQQVRDEATAVAKELRKAIRDHEQNLRTLRQQKNGFISWIISSVYDTTEQYHHNLDQNLAKVRPLSDKLRAFGGISVEMEDEVEVNGKKAKKKLAPLPSTTIADHSELEYVHEMKVSMDETLRNIAHDQNWRIATVAATVAVATLMVASGVGVLALPALGSAMLHGAAMGFGLALLGATWSQDVMPLITGTPSDQTWSEIGPGAFKSAAVFSLGEGVAAAGGAGAEAMWGARLMRSEAPTGILGRGWNGFGRIATNQTAQKMVGMGVTHFGIHQTWDMVEASMEGRDLHFWEKAGENTLGGLQTAAYMWGPDQRAAGLFRTFGARVLTSIAVNQTLSAGLNTWQMFRQFEKMEAEARLAETDGTQAGKEKAKRIRAQIAEQKQLSKFLKQLGKQAFAELPTHAYFGFQAGKAAGMQGMGRDFMSAKDPLKAENFRKLRERMALEEMNGQPGLISSSASWAWGKLTGRKRQPLDPSEEAKKAADAKLGATAASSVPQYQINQLVTAAKADPTGPAAEAVALLAAHYQMSPTRFIEVWSVWSKNHNVQGSRPLGNFQSGQRARMGTEEGMKPQERDTHHQSEGFLVNAENIIERDLHRAKFAKDDAARELHVGELLAIRPDRLKRPEVLENLPYDRLMAAAQQGVIGTHQEPILRALAMHFKFRTPEQMAHFFGGVKLKPGEKMSFDHMESLVLQADYARPKDQSKLLRERTLSPEAMRGMYGDAAYVSAIGQYLEDFHPTVDKQRFLIELTLSQKPFFEFVKTIEPAAPVPAGP